MSIRCDVTGDGLLRTASLPNLNGTYTIMAWVYHSSTQSGINGIFYLGTNTASNFDYLALDNPGGNTLSLFTEGFASVAGSTLALQTWTHLAVGRVDGSTLYLCINGVADFFNFSAVGTARTAADRLEIDGNVNGTGTRIFDGRYAGLKVFDAALTETEITQEMQTLRPQRFANLNLWAPTFAGSGERTRDYSGNGRDWTETGTVTDEDPPPVSYGATVPWLGTVTVAPVAPVLTLGRPPARRYGYAPQRLY